MRIIARRTLTRFVETLDGSRDQEAVKKALDAWFAETMAARWESPAEVKARFRSASIVGDRVVFNIKGNAYRLVVAIDFGRQVAFIKWVGDHQAYDRIDVRTVQYGD